MNSTWALLALAASLTGAGCDSDDSGTPSAGSGADTSFDSGGPGTADAGPGQDAGAGGDTAPGEDTGAGDPDGAAAANPVPDDYKATFTKVSDRAKSNDHEGMMVEIWLNDIAKAAWDAGAAPFAEGSILIKEHYADDTATDVMAWTTMEKRGAGYAADTGDWYWAKVMGDGTVEMDGTPAMCTGCHSAAASADWVWSKL
jgi:hypothetical protein